MPASVAEQETGTEAIIAEVSNKLSEIGDAHVAIGVLIRAVSYITEKGADFLRAASSDVNRYSAMPHLDMAFGLTNIAREYLDRADMARLAADNALFAKRVSAA